MPTPLKVKTDGIHNNLELMAHLKTFVKVSATGCWEWQGCKDRRGYGFCGFRGRTYRVHRLTNEIVNGPTSKHVCHKCDNPRCCNPDHMFIGTARDNMLDMWAKGRGSLPPRLQGENHHRAILTEKVVRMRKLHGDKLLSLRELSRTFGVTYGTVLEIVGHKTWKHVPPDAGQGLRIIDTEILSHKEYEI